MGLFSGVTKAVGSLFGGGSSSVTGGFDPWSILAQFGADMLTGYTNNYYSKKAASKQYDYTKSLMKYQNEYNAPKAQMARYAEAGLNPNLIYNQSNTSASGSVSVHPGSQPATNLLSAYNLKVQNELLRAQKDLTIDNALLTQERLNEQDAKATMAQYNADYAQAEHELWKKTGKIPQSYYKSDWQAELTSLLKGFFN